MSSIPLLLLAACFQTNADKPAADAPPPSPTAQPPAETPQPASAATLPDLTEGLVSGQCEDGPGAEGADSHFFGQYTFSGSKVSGEERWLLTANEKWKKRGEDYEEFKQAISDKILEEFLERMPGLRDMVDYVELSTPLSTDHFCRPMAGSIYGIEPTPERFKNPWLRPRSPIKNLYFAGSEVTAVGVMGAMLGGVVSAMSIAPLQTLRYMRE